MVGLMKDMVAAITVLHGNRAITMHIVLMAVVDLKGEIWHL